MYMDASLYAEMLSDRSVNDLKKLGYKYPEADMGEFVKLLRRYVYKKLPLLDDAGHSLVYIENAARVRFGTAKLLLAPRPSREPYGLRAMEDEISASLAIDGAVFSRDCVRKILGGDGPGDESGNCVYGMKNGLDFIADPVNTITEESIRELYGLAVNPYIGGGRLAPGEMYRSGDEPEPGAAGLPYGKLSVFMRRLVNFMKYDSSMDDLLKAATVHFYIAYLRPYNDGNGRMARLMQLWLLRRLGYSSALFIPFSGNVERSGGKYGTAFDVVSTNAEISGVVDITPFLAYFIGNVYDKLEDTYHARNGASAFLKAVEGGSITLKERELWNFVLSAYGGSEFSTKQLEREFVNAAYGTIRTFVQKFEQYGLLTARQYGSRVAYSVV
jgi:Fic family protein